MEQLPIPRPERGHDPSSRAVDSAPGVPTRVMENNDRAYHILDRFLARFSGGQDNGYGSLVGRGDGQPDS